MRPGETVYQGGRGGAPASKHMSGPVTCARERGAASGVNGGSGLR